MGGHTESKKKAQTKPMLTAEQMSSAKQIIEICGKFLSAHDEKLSEVQSASLDLVKKIKVQLELATQNNNQIYLDTAALSLQSLSDYVSVQPNKGPIHVFFLEIKNFFASLGVGKLKTTEKQDLDCAWLKDISARAEAGLGVVGSMFVGSSSSLTSKAEVLISEVFSLTSLCQAFKEWHNEHNGGSEDPKMKFVEQVSAILVDKSVYGNEARLQKIASLSRPNAGGGRLYGGVTAEVLSKTKKEDIITLPKDYNEQQKFDAVSQQAHRFDLIVGKCERASSLVAPADDSKSQSTASVST